MSDDVYSQVGSKEKEARVRGVKCRVWFRILNAVNPKLHLLKTDQNQGNTV